MSSTVHEDDDDGDVLNDIHSNGLEEGFFGIFFTISREKKSVLQKKWAVLILCIEFLQVLNFTLNKDVGWAKQLDVVWNGLAYFTIKNPFISLGYGFFLASFSFFALLLTFSLAVCGFVGFLFKRNTFPFEWPIKFVRVIFALMVFFPVCAIHFYRLEGWCVLHQRAESISVLTFLRLRKHHERPEFRAEGEGFPHTKVFFFWCAAAQPVPSCWEMPHAIVAVFGAIFSLLLSFTGEKKSYLSLFLLSCDEDDEHFVFLLVGSTAESFTQKTTFFCILVGLFPSYLEQAFDPLSLTFILVQECLLPSCPSSRKSTPETLWHQQ